MPAIFLPPARCRSNDPFGIARGTWACPDRSLRLISSCDGVAACAADCAGAVESGVSKATGIVTAAGLVLGASGIASAQDAPMVAGTIRKVDVAQGKLTIAHGPIPNLDMAAMTMAFRAGDKAMLKRVRKGDKVRFQAGVVNGEVTVTRIERGR